MDCWVIGSWEQKKNRALKKKKKKAERRNVSCLVMAQTYLKLHCRSVAFDFSCIFGVDCRSSSFRCAVLVIGGRLMAIIKLNDAAILVPRAVHCF